MDHSEADPISHLHKPIHLAPSLFNQAAFKYNKTTEFMHGQEFFDLINWFNLCLRNAASHVSSKIVFFYLCDADIWWNYERNMRYWRSRQRRPPTSLPASRRRQCLYKTLGDREGASLIVLLLTRDRKPADSGNELKGLWLHPAAPCVFMDTPWPGGCEWTRPRNQRTATWHSTCILHPFIVPPLLPRRQVPHRWVRAHSGGFDSGQALTSCTSLIIHFCHKG